MKNAIPPLRQKLKEVVSEAMLDAAEQCLIEHGYEQTTMQHIATAAGCAIGTLYLHHKNKDEIFRAILNRLGQAIHNVIIRCYHDQALPPLERMRQASVAFVRYANEHQAFFRVFLNAMPLRPRHFRHFVNPETWDRREVELSLELQCLAEAQRLGHIRGDLSVQLLQELLDSVHLSAVEIFLNSPTPVPVEQQADWLWKFASSGLAAKPQ